MTQRCRSRGGWWWIAALLVACASAAQAQPIVRGMGDVAVAAPHVTLTDVSVNAATQVGDLLLTICQSENTPAVDTPGGWSIVPGSPSTNATRATQASVFYREATAADVDGNCEACVVPAHVNHLLCSIMSVANYNSSWNGDGTCSGCFDVFNGNPQEIGTLVQVSGATAGDTNTLVVVIASGSNDYSGSGITGWANAALTSLTTQLNATTIVGSDGTLGIATGAKATTGTWGTTTATSSTGMAWANFSFNIRQAAGTATPASTATGTVTQTATITLTPTITRTPTVTGTATATGTQTATPTVTATGTRTETGTATSTKTATATVTLTPTITPVPAKCLMRAANGAIALKSSCTLPEDDGFFVFEKPTPGVPHFVGFGASMPFRFFRDANETVIGDNPHPDTLQVDATLTASQAVDARWVQFGVAPAFEAPLDSARIRDAGGCANDQPCSIDGDYNFIGANPPRRNGMPMAPLNLLNIACGPVPLNAVSYYCTLSGQGPYSTADTGETRQAAGCTVAHAAVTAFDSGDKAAIPTNCTASVALTVNEVTTPGSLVALLAGDTTADAAGDGEAWSEGDDVGLVMQSLGIGCVGARTFEVSLACGGD